MGVRIKQPNSKCLPWPHFGEGVCSRECAACPEGSKQARLLGPKGS